MTPDERFWSKVAKTDDGCWLWTAGGTKAGYGLFHPSTVKVYAHRYSYVLANGPIPEGMVVRHDCDTPRCVNPAHLRLGTNADNVRDRVQRGRTTRKGAPSGSTCRRGHERNEANVYRRPDGKISCRVCRVDRDRARGLKPANRLSDDEARTVAAMYTSGAGSQREVGAMFGITASGVSRVLARAGAR